MSTLTNENETTQKETNEQTLPVNTKEEVKDIVKEENVVNNEEQIQLKEINTVTKEENEQVDQTVNEKETMKEEVDVKEKDIDEESKSKTNEISEQQPKECDDVMKENKVNTIEEEVKEIKSNTEIDNDEIKDKDQQIDNNTTNNEQIIKTENTNEVIKEQTVIDKIDTTNNNINNNEQQQEIIEDNNNNNQQEQNKQNDNEEQQQQQQNTQQEENIIPNETTSKEEPPQQQEQQEQQPSTNPHLDSLTETYKTLHNTFPSTTYPLLSPLLSLITSQLTTYSTLTTLPPSSPEYTSLLSSNITSLSSSLSSLLPLNPHPSFSLSSPISFSIPLSKPQIKKRQASSKPNYQTNSSTTKHFKPSTKPSKLNRSSDSLSSPTKQPSSSKQSAPSSVQPKQHTRIHNNSNITSSPPSNTLSSLHNFKSQNTSTTKHIRSSSMKMPNTTDKTDTYTQANTNHPNPTNKEQSVFLSAIHVNRPTKHIKKGVPEHCKKHQKIFNKSNSAKRIGYSSSSSARTSAVPTKHKETATPVAGKTILPDKNILDYASFHEKTEKEFENIGAKPSSYAKYLVKKYKDVVQNYQQVDEDEQKTSGKKINKKETNSNHSINGSNIDLYDYLKRNKQKFKHYKYNFLYEGEDGRKVSATTENTNMNAVDNNNPKTLSKIQVLKKK